MDTVNPASRKLAVTIYEHSRNPAGRAAATTFDKIVALLKNREFRAVKDGKAFGGYRLKTGTSRGNANVDYVSLAVADIDDGTPLDDLRAAIGPYEWVATSSHSHSPEKCKYRIVFPLSRDLQPAEWKAFKAGFDQLFSGHNDPATKDISRLFFLPSCDVSNADHAFFEHNQGTWMDPASCMAMNMLLTGEAPPEVEQPKRYENEFGGSEYPPSSLEKIAEKCAVVKWFKDTGCPHEPTWFMSLNTAAHTVDGQKLAHEWSAKDPRYDPAQTQAKLDSSKGPPSCEKIKAKLDLDVMAKHGVTLCGTCTETCTHPINLGYINVDAPPVVSDVSETGEEKQFIPPHWPAKFFVRTGSIYFLPDADADPLPVCTPMFYLVDRIRDEEGTFVYKARMNVRGAEWREFEIPAKVTAEPKALKGLLAAYEIVVFSDVALMRYLNEYKIELRKYADEIRTFKQFGWNDGGTGLLVGTQLVTMDSRVEVRVSDSYIKDESLLNAGNVKGTKEDWINGVETLYNVPDAGPYQYAICHQFGVPLIGLMDLEEWNGIPFALTSKATGIGKSTVVKIGINALTNCAATMLGNTTLKGIITRAGIVNNLPFLVDEITKTIKDPDELSDLTYQFFNGRPRNGAGSDGKERQGGLAYKTSPTWTGNDSLIGTIAQSKLTSPEAVMARIFEISLNDYPIIEHSQHSELAARLSGGVYGVFTEDYVKFVNENRADVMERLDKTINALRQFCGTAYSEERFLVYEAATTLVGGWIARKIGAVKFSITDLAKFAKSHILLMRQLRSDFSAKLEDQFAQFLADLHGYVLVTHEFDALDSRHGKTEIPRFPLRGAPKARLVLGTDKERSKLFVTVKALDDWCAKERISAPDFKRDLAAGKFLRGGGDQGRGYDRKISINKGVPDVAGGQTRCLEVDHMLAQGYRSEYVETNVVEISSKKQQSVADSVAEESTGTA